MQCPKCEREKLQDIRFKKDSRLAYLCDICSTVWYMGEEINPFTGRLITLVTDGQDREYTFDMIDETPENITAPKSLVR